MGKKITTEEFIKRAKFVHGDAYDYTKTNFIKSSEKVCITCPKHGDFWQLPFNHLRGAICKKCDNEKKSLEKTMTIDEFIDKAKKIHGDKYDYSKVIYTGIFNKICIVCPEHGDFYQVPNYHLSGNGCPKCAVKLVWDKRGRITTDEFIDKAKKIHGDKYDYSETKYENRRTKVNIVCHKKFKNGTEHGVFSQTPGSHLRGCGCPHCRSSYLETKVFKLLTEKNVKFETEKTYQWLVKGNHMYLDFYLPDYNTAIECQGIQHYADIKIRGQNRYTEIHGNDLLKNQLCKDNGIKIFYFTDKNMYDNYCYNKESTYYDFDSMLKDIQNGSAS